MKKFLLTIACLVMCCALFSQHDIMFSQQFFSRINKNPAGTGNYEGIDLFLVGRLQFVGMDNSPRTLLLNGTGYSEKYKSSVGLSILSDKVSIAKRNDNFKLVYAYHIDLSDNYLLSLGVSGGVNNFSFNPSKHTIRDEGETSETYPQEKVSELDADFDFGAELANEHLLFGASVKHILENEQTTFSNMRHFYLYGRGYFPVAENLDLAPALIFMCADDVAELDINAMLFYKRMLWGGLTYRPDMKDGFKGAAVAGQIGIEYKNMRVGYCLEIGGRTSSTSHELILSVGLGK